MRSDGVRDIRGKPIGVHRFYNYITYTERHPSNSSLIISPSNPALDGRQ